MNEREPRGDKDKRKPLRMEVAEIDKQVLRLLLKRHNLLEKMRHNGRIDPGEEKFLRESWQAEAAKVSRDAELSGRFFSLMQSVGFLPRPAPVAADAPGALRREAFNLAPSRQPVNIDIAAPLDTSSTRAWLFLAACSGQPTRLSPCSQSDPVVDFIKALDQMGAAITRIEEANESRAASPLGAPDKVIHAGSSEAGLYLLLAHYLGRHSRAKFTGETSLKLADLSRVRHFLPELGARLTHVVPRSDGLPARLECSGILPPVVSIPEDLPASFAEALILAAPFYAEPLGVDVSAQPNREQIMAHTLPFLESSGITFTVDGFGISLEPCAPAIPQKPSLPVDASVASFLLALAAPLGGKTRLTGFWPSWLDDAALWDLAIFCGLPWKKAEHQIMTENPSPIASFRLGAAPRALLETAADHAPVLVALAACAALNGGHATLPEIYLSLPETADFLNATGLEPGSGGAIQPQLEPSSPSPWNAPSPTWAMALALAACARGRRSGFLLGNPGIMTELWPSFWACYNSLPTPRPKKTDVKDEPAQPKRRRIITSSVAVPREIREEDWERR